MCCRENAGSSAVVSLAQRQTGLDDRQVSSVFHRERRAFEATNRTGPDPELAQDTWAKVDRDIRTSGLPDMVADDLRDRVEKGQQQPVPDNATLHAMRTTVAESERAQAALRSAVNATALEGLSADGKDALFDSYRQRALNDRELRAPRDFESKLRDRGDVPADRSTAYALWRLRQDAARQVAVRDAEIDAEDLKVSYLRLRQSKGEALALADPSLTDTQVNAALDQDAELRGIEDERAQRLAHASALFRNDQA